MTRLTIVADIHARPGRADDLRAALERLIPPTRAEAGCVQYDLHRDDADPGHFLFFEIWETRAHWLAHMATPHIAAHRAATEGAVASATISEMRQIA